MIAVSNGSTIPVPKINTGFSDHLFKISFEKLKLTVDTKPYSEPISLLVK